MNNIKLHADWHEGREMTRALGGLEHSFWAYDRHRPLQFSMVGRIEGTYPDEQWRDAFSQMLRRHPALGLTIELSHGQPVFKQRRAADIPVRVVDHRPGSGWPIEVERELQTTFGVLGDAMLRATLIDEADSTVLVLSAHHSLADGLSLATAIRDIAAILAGHAAPASPAHACADNVLGVVPVASGANYDRAQVDSELVEAARRRRRMQPVVATAELSAALTTRLRERCRVENTTVHAALSVAIAFSRWNSGAHPIDRPVDIFSPINLRRGLSLGDVTGLWVSGGTTAIPASAEPTFWELARAANRDLDKARPVSVAHQLAGQLCQFTQQGVSPKAAYDLFATVFRNDVMLTNLGSLGPSELGDSALTELWGPSVTLGDHLEQTVGVVSWNGKLRLVYTTYEAIPDYLDMLVEVIREACV